MMISTTASKRGPTAAIDSRPIRRSRKRPYDRLENESEEDAEKHVRTTSRKKTKESKKRHVSWSSREPSIYILPDNHSSFPDYDEREVWYTRQNYLGFLMDRLETIQALSTARGDANGIASNRYSLRGLEVYHSVEAKKESTSMRKVHQSTVLIEQARQSLYGMNNQERFRLLVSPQSELAAQRARRLASVDEHEVYGNIGRSESYLLSSLNMADSAITGIVPTRNVGGLRTILKPAILPTRDMLIQELQQANARRLIEIYSQPGYNPFRFPLRRDSLFGTNLTVRAGTISSRELLSIPYDQFQIRRDSLTAIGPRGFT